MRFRCQRSFVVLLLSLVCVAVAHGQSAQINGTVNDASGASVPKAVVTAKNTATNAVRTAETGESGAYVITNLRPGTYNLSISKSSFRTVEISGVVLTVDQALTLNTTLEVSATEQSVTVLGESVAQVDSTDAQISSVVDSRQMRELPLILRDPYQLILLTPGTVATNSGLGGFAVNGSRERNNNFQLDGADNNDPGVPAGGVAALNPDVTEEFRIISNNFEAEFGRNTGAVIDIITKSGTNNLHGDVYWFGRYSALGARDFFNPAQGPNGRVMDPYVRNDFGASVGGPVIKDKTFFFFNYEGQRFATTVTPAPATVPTPAFRSGIFTFTDQSTGTPFTYNVSTPTSAQNTHNLALDPLVQKVMALYPTTGLVPGPDDARDFFFFASPDHFSANNYTAKVDHSFSSRHQLSVRYVASKVIDDNTGHLENLPGIGGVAFHGLTQNLGGHLISTFSTKVVNDLHASGLRSHGPFTCTGLDILNSLGASDEFGRSRDWTFANGAIAPIACSALGGSNGQTRAFGTYTLGDKLTWILGRHTTKFGVDFGDAYENNFNDFGSRSAPNFAIFTNGGPDALGGPHGSDTLQDMVWSLFGSVFQESQTQFFTTSGVRNGQDLRGIREHDVYGFWQDTFKIRPNLTLTYGLRYEFNGTPYEVHDQLSTVSPAAISGPAPVVFQVAGRHGNIPLYPTDFGGFEPRVGFAWDPFKSGRTSIRGGYGLFRDRSFFNFIGNTRSNPPFTQTFTNNAFADSGATAADQISNIPLPTTVTAPSASVPDFSLIFTGTVDTALRIPTTQDWNFSVQRELPANVLLEVRYVGAKTDHLSRVVDGNAPDPVKIAALRDFCHTTGNCVDTPTASQVRGVGLYIGAELGLFPFDAVNNSAFFHENLTKSIASSIYHALQVSATRRLSHGMFVQLNYTYSHSIDDSGDTLAPESGNVVFPVDSFDLRLERGNSGTDVRHSAIINYTAELPLGRGKSRLSQGFLGRALEGWSLSGITAFSAGTPYEIFTTKDSAGTGSTQRPDFNPNGTLVPLAPGNSQRTQTGPNVGLFSRPAYGTHGSLGRNVFAGPGINNWDMVVSKNTQLSERFRLEFRTEAYNLFNHAHFARPAHFIENVNTFGQSSSTVGRPDGTTSARQLQAALKLHF